MIPNPIVKVLSTLFFHGVRHLLMGGQACVFYGAAEFSRDCDIVLFADDANLDRLRAALDELRAKCIAIPPFDLRYLERGHAVHFRCEHDEARGMRLDVMTRMRGVDEFEALWDRRTTLADDAGLRFDLLGIHDLVKAKKTQRNRDWPMIQRLIEAQFESHRGAATRTHPRLHDPLGRVVPPRDWAAARRTSGAEPRIRRIRRQRPAVPLRRRPNPAVRSGGAAP